MSRPPTRDLVRYAESAVLLAAVLAVGARGEAVIAGHPSLPVVMVLLVGLAVGLSVSTGRVPGRRPGTLGRTGRVAEALAVLVIAAALVWLRPFPATARATDALSGMPGRVDVRVTPTRIALLPRGGGAAAGLVFLPGARVDPRAYMRVLLPVAASGHAVVIVKPPFGIAFLAADGVDEAIDGTAGPARWAVGGHSLGGVAAARAVGSDDRISGLILWASFPAGDMSDRTDLHVASVWGTRDGLTTPADVERSRADLPPATVFTRVDGATHAHFGDYGDQPGDGEPATTRESAQRAIAGATIALLDGMDAGGAVQDTRPSPSPGP